MHWISVVTLVAIGLRVTTGYVPGRRSPPARLLRLRAHQQGQPQNIGLDVKRVSQVEDDGYTASRREPRRGWFISTLRMMLDMLNPREPGVLILVRHGQTTMNYNKTFTGEHAPSEGRQRRQTRPTNRLCIQAGSIVTSRPRARGRWNTRHVFYWRGGSR